MRITNMFNSMMNWFEPFLGNVTLIMAIIAFLVIAIGIFFMIKKERYGKYLSLVGCALLINPLIYLFLH